MKKTTTVDDFLFEKVVNAFTDLLDGNHKWYEIKKRTGLSDERCKEIEDLFNALSEVYYK